VQDLPAINIQIDQNANDDNLLKQKKENIMMYALQQPTTNFGALINPAG
jgi:hypothetical protein